MSSSQPSSLQSPRVMADTEEITPISDSREGEEAPVSDSEEGPSGDQGADCVQHVVIPSDGGSESIGICQEDGSGEPVTKKIRLVQEDGQILVLAVSGQEGALSGVTEYQAGEMARPTLPVNTDVTQAWFTKKGEKSALHQTGHSWKQGQWSKEEVEILQSNILLYCKERNISDPTEIIFEMNKDERKDFYRCVAQGLERPLFSVYRRVIRMYDQKNYMGKYTPEEIDKLKELRRLHGTDWATIGASLGRSASSVKDRCRLMKDTCMTGKWLPAEEKRLAEAVYELAGVEPTENVTSGLSWSAVAERVSSRSEKQCRSKWLNYLNWKQSGGTEWTREDDISLVLKIAESGITDETQLDWNQLAKNWSSVRSPQWLRGKWWSLKRHVPDCHVLPFTEIVKHLTDYHSQTVRSKNPSLRFTHLPRVSVMSAPGLTLQVPVAVAQGGNTVTTLASDDSDSNFQAYELIQHVPTSGTYLITQPHNNPAISFTSGTMATDHIIVHTLPVVQNKGVPLSLHTAYHNSGVQTIEGSDMQRIVISDVTTSSADDELHLHIKEDPNGVGEIISSSSTIGEMIATSQGSFESVDGTVITTSSPSEEAGSLTMSSTTDTAVTQVDKATNRELIMSSLSDPMLASEPDNSELMESTCEVETEKSPTEES